MNANGKRISELVIGCAIAVSNELGSGFLEAVYSNALAIEFTHAGLHSNVSVSCVSDTSTQM